MRFIWATRGKTWGFRFLRTGELSDPLLAYSAAFDQYEGARELCERVGDVTALRFEDPLGRKDRAGRVVPHEFVIFDSEAFAVETVAGGVALVWPVVQAEYASYYKLDQPTGLNV